MNEKIFICGSNGQLGSECLDYFSQKTEVLGIDKEILDLSNDHKLYDCLDNYKPSIIINCAGYTLVDKCESDSLCWNINKNIPEYLSIWASKNNTLLIHISTDYVFDGEKKLFHPWLENDKPNPISEYGRSKLAGEEVIQMNMNNYSIIRTSWLYGKKGNNFLKNILRLISDSNITTPLNIVNDQYGSPTWTYSLVKQIDLIIKNKVKGIIHASSEGYCTWFDLASELTKILEIESHFLPCLTSEYPTEAKRPMNSILENKRLKEEGINCFEDWKIELKSFININRNILLKK